MPYKSIEKRREYRRAHPELKYSRTKKCSKCHRFVMARGMCQMHYNRWYRRHGPHAEKYREHDRKRDIARDARRYARASIVLPDWLLRKWLSRHAGIKASQVPAEILPLYRTHIQLKREILNERRSDAHNSSR